MLQSKWEQTAAMAAVDETAAKQGNPTHNTTTTKAQTPNQPNQRDQRYPKPSKIDFEIKSMAGKTGLIFQKT